MACNRWSDRIDALVDGELPEDSRREFDAHLSGCASCAAEIAGRAQLKTAVKRAALHRYRPSADFRRKVEAQVLPREQGSRVRRAARIWLPAVGFAAGLALVVLWTALRPSGGGPTAALNELVDMHVAALASTNPVDVVSTDQHTVKPWFEGKLPFAVNVPDVTNAPFTLLGGRVAYLDQQPGAALLFQYRKHRLSVFIFEDRGAWKSDGLAGARQHASFWVDTWAAGGLRYFVVGDTSGQNVADLSNLMKRAAGEQ